MVRIIFLALWRALLRFLVFSLLLLAQTAAFQADSGALHVNLNVLHLIKLSVVARRLCALLRKLRSCKLAVHPRLARFLRHGKQKTRKRQQECIAQ